MQKPERYALYSAQIANAVPRALTELDRDPFSLTYGCFDREYWAWATKDFANFDLQRSIYPLTFCYLHKFPGNKWYGSPRLIKWIKAAFGYCRTVQHKNGSFDHHYPNEYSVVGTAFPLAELGLAYQMLHQAGELTKNEQTSWCEFFSRCANFLCDMDETHGFISNHRLGAVCGLYLIFKLTNEKRFIDRAELILQTVQNKMSKEGWLLEYTGADPGYQTLDTNFMGHYFRLSNDHVFLEKVVLPSLEFLIYFFHPDGSIGGEHGSRNCPLYYPGGFEVFAPYSPIAESMARLGAQAILDGSTTGLNAHDIRNFVPMLSSYCLALEQSSSEKKSIIGCEMPWEREFERFWPDAGLYIRSDKERYTIVGCSKGGVTKVFNKNTNNLEAANSGYYADDKVGTSWSTQFHENNIVSGLEDCIGAEVELKPSRVFQVESEFYRVPSKRFFTPLRFLIFRIFVLTIGRNIWLNNWVKRNIIIGIFIGRRNKLGLRLNRELVFDKEKVIIRDKLAGIGNVRFTHLRGGDIFTTIYMGSSKYYRNMENIADELSNRNLLESAQNSKGILVYELSSKGFNLIEKK